VAGDSLDYSVHSIKLEAAGTRSPTIAADTPRRTSRPTARGVQERHIGLALMQKQGLTLDMHGYIDRAMTIHLKTDLKIFPAVALIGPRQR
jgi:hypothetical protein